MSKTSPFPIHLWIYNHPFYGISDQVEFFSMNFRQHGYGVTVGRQPRREALNVVIENFDDMSREVLQSFCHATDKRVVVILTEHLDFLGEQLHIHGDPLWRDNDYMLPATQVARIRNLIECLHCIRGFLVLGDLPRLQNLDQVFPGVDMRWLPFPELESQHIKREPENINNDLSFSGFITEYRTSVLELLRGLGFGVVCPYKFISRHRRDILNRTSKIVLNIPQRKGWQWLSLMRIIAALRCGRATVSLETQDTSEIAACTHQLLISTPDWEDRLKDYTNNWRDYFEKALMDYHEMSHKFADRYPFPHDMIEFWAVTDRLAKV